MLTYETIGNFCLSRFPKFVSRILCVILTIRENAYFIFFKKREMIVLLELSCNKKKQLYTLKFILDSHWSQTHINFLTFQKVSSYVDVKEVNTIFLSLSENTLALLKDSKIGCYVLWLSWSLTVQFHSSPPPNMLLFTAIFPVINKRKNNRQKTYYRHIIQKDNYHMKILILIF